MNQEIWVQIPNFSRYEISNFGNLRSLNYKNSGKIKQIKPALTPDGYMRTMLQNDDGKYCSWRVHKWAALTFLGEKPIGMEVNHLDGNKANNAASNLEYTNRSGNIKHAYDMGLLMPKSGMTNGNSKLTDLDIIEIRTHAKKFAPNYGRKALAEKYNVSEAHIKDIVTRRRNIWPTV